MTTQQAIDAALAGIEQAGKAALAGAGTDAQTAADAAREFAHQLATDTELLVTAAADAAARGEDTATWAAGLTALLQAAALRTVTLVVELSDAEAGRLRDVGLGALHVLIGLLPVLLAAA